MTLHARQVAIAAGAQPDEINRTVKRLVSEGTVRVDRAVEILNEIRISSKR
jgi:hydroxymethylglutaryl-CoA reductase